MSATCVLCGEVLPHDHGPAIRFRVPDPLVGVDESTYWSSDPNPLAAVLLQADGVGQFVRATLYAQTGASSGSWGVWVAVAPGDFARFAALWNDERYGSLGCDGILGNAVDGELDLGALVSITVLAADQLPVVVR